LLADDRWEIVEIVLILLADEFNVVGVAENGVETVELATKLHPDAIVLDISMPLVNGIDVTWHLKTLRSCAKIVVLTVDADPDFLEAALAAGALGYVMKPSLSTDLIPAIRAALNGVTYISPQLQFP
jgi:DNA-binding NarL/FixJ family response regulator